NDREHRTEDLFPRDFHRGLDTVEHARADQEAAVGWCGRAAVQYDVRTLALTDRNVARHTVEMLARDDRAHVDLGTSIRRADLHALGRRAEPFDQRIGDLTDWHGDAAGHAALAGTSEGRKLERADGLIEIGIGHDDEMVLGAAGGLHSLAVLCARQVNMPGH